MSNKLKGKFSKSKHFFARRYGKKNKCIRHPANISFFSIFFTTLVMFFLVCMIISPAKFIQSSLDGISAWAFNVLPSVLPFMFFTRVLSALDLMPTITRPFSPISQNLFKTPPISIYAFCMAILSGYPVGSKMVADLFMQGQISKEDAFKMSAFCSTSGPMFIVGAVGASMFHSAKIGYILFLSHVVGAVLNGIAWRNFKLKKEIDSELKVNNLSHNEKEILNKNIIEKDEKLSQNQLQNFMENISQNDETEKNKTQKNAKKADFLQKNEKTRPNFDLAEIVTNSTLSILSVGCIITIFFIVIECFSPLFSLLPQNVACFLEGIVEITKGCIDLSKLSNLNLAITLCSFVISFGGISTILQSLTMLSSVQMPVKLFVLQKLTHAIFATITTILILLIL